MSLSVVSSQSLVFRRIVSPFRWLPSPWLMPLSDWPPLTVMLDASSIQTLYFAISPLPASLAPTTGGGHDPGAMRALFRPRGSRAPEGVNGVLRLWHFLGTLTHCLY